MKSLVIGCAAMLLIYIFSSSLLQTIHPPVWPDEAIYAEVVENVLENGQIRSDLWEDAILNIQTKAMWNPPMFFYEYAAWQYVWGISIVHQRLLVQIVGFLNLIMILLLLRNTKNAYTLTTLGLWITNVVIAKGTRFARPEMFVLFFGLVGMYAAVVAFRGEKRLNRYHCIAGVSFSVAILNHLFGLVFLLGLGAVGLMQIRTKAIKHYVYILIIALLGLAPWVIDITRHWSTFIQQFKLSSYPRSVVDSWLTSHLTIGGPDEQIIIIGYISITLLIGFTVMKKWRERLKVTQTPQLLFFVILVFSWILSVRAKSEFYAIFPLTLTIINWGIRINDTAFPIVRKACFYIIAIVLITQISQTFSLLSKGLSSQNNYQAFAEEVRNNIPENSTVFISAIPDPYFELVKIKGVTMYEFPAVPIERSKYIELLNNSDYIVYTGHYEEHLFGDFLNTYIELNLDRPIEIYAGGYKAHIFKMKDVSKRITTF